MRLYIATQGQLMMAVAIGVLLIISALLVIVLITKFFQETVEKTSRDEQLVCRACGSKSIRSSYPSGLMDAMFSLFAWRPFRCDVCYWRFYSRRRDRRGPVAHS